MKTLISMTMAALSILALGSCGSRTGAAIGGPGGNTGAPNKTWNDQQTDPTLCKGTSISSLVGQWSMNQVSGSITRTLTLLIQDGTTTLTAGCILGTLSRTATSTVSSSFDANRLYLQGTSDKVVGDRQLSCEASLVQGNTTYKIVGRCLTININGPHTFRYVGN